MGFYDKLVGGGVEGINIILIVIILMLLLVLIIAAIIIITTITTIILTIITIIYVYIGTYVHTYIDLFLAVRIGRGPGSKRWRLVYHCIDISVPIDYFYKDL